MPRLPRTVFANVPHHVTQRGNRREAIFFANEDRELYLSWLKEYCDKHQVEVLAYCLMTNHIHLVAVPSTADRGRNSFRHPALRTVRAVLPHTALQLAVSTSGLACQIDMGFV